MQTKKSIPNLYSAIAHNKIGIPNLFGTTRFGWSEFGVNMIEAGIYIYRRAKKYSRSWRRDFYQYARGTSVARDNASIKFGQAVSAWQALSDSQKMRYNDLAVGKRMHGYNLFISRYMKL